MSTSYSPIARFDDVGLLDRAVHHPRSDRTFPIEQGASRVPRSPDEADDLRASFDERAGQPRTQKPGASR